MKSILVDEYQDPQIYDAEYGGYTNDFDIFLGIKKSGLALDLACGTGRLTIALAQSGLTCIGIDENPNMLVFAKKKAGLLPVKFLQGDIRNFCLKQKFDLITMAGNSFQALLTTGDQKSCMLAVRSHLNRNGIFAFNTRNPQEKDFVTTLEFAHWHDFVDSSGNKVRVMGRQRYDEEAQTVTYTTKRIWDVNDTISEITLSFTPFNELMKLLDNCGFTIYKTYGDVRRIPFTKQSRSIFVLCKATPSSSHSKISQATRMTPPQIQASAYSDGSHEYRIQAN